jgi:hypothetical protein
MGVPQVVFPISGHPRGFPKGGSPNGSSRMGIALVAFHKVFNQGGPTRVSGKRGQRRGSPKMDPPVGGPPRGFQKKRIPHWGPTKGIPEWDLHKGDPTWLSPKVRPQRVPQVGSRKGVSPSWVPQGVFPKCVGAGSWCAVPVRVRVGRWWCDVRVQGWRFAVLLGCGADVCEGSGVWGCYTAVVRGCVWPWWCDVFPRWFCGIVPVVGAGW